MSSHEVVFRLLTRADIYQAVEVFQALRNYFILMDIRKFSSLNSVPKESFGKKCHPLKQLKMPEKMAL